MVPESEEILRLVADYFALSPDELAKGRRTLLRTWARHCTAFLLRRTARYSLADIARILRYGDHTSVLSALKRVDAEIGQNHVLASQVRHLLGELESLEVARYGQTTRG